MGRTPNAFLNFVFEGLPGSNRAWLLVVYVVYVGGVGSVVERRSLADVLSLSCARPAADG